MSQQSIGIGSTWAALNRVATHGLNTVGNLASAGDAMSQSVEANSWVELAKDSIKMCEDLGIQVASPKEAIDARKNILSQLRGY